MSQKERPRGRGQSCFAQPEIDSRKRELKRRNKDEGAKFSHRLGVTTGCFARFANGFVDIGGSLDGKGSPAWADTTRWALPGCSPNMRGLRPRKGLGHQSDSSCESH